MKGTKALLLAFLAVALLASACSSGGTAQEPVQEPGTEGEGRASNLNPEGFPIVNEPISMTAFGCKDANHLPWKDVLVLKEYEKRTNIRMIYEETPQQGCEETRNLNFASNELPDVFLRAGLPNTDIARYGMKEKMLIPLEGLIEEYAPNVKRLFEEYPDAKKSVTAPDGHIYALPVFNLTPSSRTEKIWINQTWLEKLGLEKPTTLDELKTVLRAFRDQDPNGNGLQDEIPLGLREPLYLYTAFTGSFGLDRQFSYNINIENDKVHIWVGDDRYKEMLMFLNELYSEGLLYKDFFTRDIPKWRSNLSQAMFGMMYIFASDPFTQVEDQFTGMAPIVGPYGDQLFSPGTPVASGGSFAISRENKHPEAAMRWVDYFYSEEGSTYFQYGIEGETYQMVDGKPELADSIKNDSRGLMAALGEVNLVPGGGFPTAIYTSVVLNPKTEEVASYVIDYLPETIYGAPIFDQETTDTILPIKADLDKYVEESSVKFVIGELSFDKWDEYTETLKKMKIDELEKIYQQAYDNLNP